jgi:murein DD-endopeptidase MepM/ murein hydrolase activator NlpD
MELQFHPASGRGRVRTLALGPVGERAAIGIAALAATLAWSLVITVPAMAARRVRQDAFTTVVAESRQRRAELARVAHLVSALRARALDQGDLLNRVAFLYGVAPAAWPRVLNPERSWLSQAPPETVSDRLSGYLRALERAQGIVGAAERAEPSRALTMPSIVPVEAGLFEPLARFGPRVSPWTGEEEFFPGVELAAPAGSAVVSPAEGTVAFTGNVRRTSGGWLWRLGNVIVVSHGAPGATVFGHLARIEVRRGQRVRRGDRIGTVGASGWALSPQLHYEFWRAERGGLRPI